MAYNITLTNGTNLVTVADGTTDTSYSSLTLIGKNFAGYGEFVNENFVHLLENFSSGTAPNHPIAGQIWWNSSSNAMQVYTGSQWKALGSSTISATSPSGPQNGDAWWDTNTKQFKVYDTTTSSWLVVGPSYPNNVKSGAILETVVDTPSATTHNVVKLYVNDEVIGILSADPLFNIHTSGSNSISGFSVIGPGLTLKGYNTSDFGATGDKLFGTAENALRLGGKEASEYVTVSNPPPMTEQLKVQSDDGVTFGDSDEGQLLVSGNDIIIRNNVSAGDILMQVKVGSTNTTVATVDGGTGKMLVSDDPTAPLGVATKQYVDNQLSSVGVALARDGSNTITGTILPSVNNVHNFGSSSASFNTIYATTFSGTAVTARYADLAERFESDKVYRPGTVVELGGVKEITAASEDLTENVFGVISTQAAFTMNSAAGEDETHPAIAVQGRVPVNVIGQVRKGDRLVSAGNGLARAAKRSEITPFNVIGRALESKYTEGEGTVEAVVRLNS